ncbi:hypothetical protein PPERSA_02810 [Pseudocohnilembus persalinus]|uniref:Uncharacterized protein n=1 Tax=Pseudocohnilembus persalinus TaxID=266149 RepID=A0A0V0QMP5_PSEPJ|nr:hypothetical protein PPERSA_02810 [Pseudocohnilembus persalinus]|eukprot:KRX03431.1 hypothetical protein PPERSA_02810 [Pseudocohnilembus persalinus]
MLSKVFAKNFVKTLNTLQKQNIVRGKKGVVEELKRVNTFDQQVKEKYLYNNDNLRNMDINDIKARITEEYEAQNDKLFNDDSILSQIKNDMFDNQEIKDQKQRLNDLQSRAKENYEQQPMEKYFSNLSHDEYLQKAREFQNDIMFGRIPDPERRTNAISRDYANYSSFEENGVELKDMQNEWEEFPTEVYQGKRILSFLNNLDSDVAQKKQIEESMQELRLTNPNLKDSQIIKGHFENEANRIMKEKNLKHEFDLGDNRLESDIQQFRTSTRLSPTAKEQIFKLYAKGWSVRDLSSRFGILPERVKAVIWLKQKFYFEVLPNIDLRTLKAGMERELEYNRDFKYQDYGIDLEELSRRNKGILTPSFKKQKDVDVKQLAVAEQRKENQIERTSKRRRARSQKVTTGFVGNQEKGYYIKEWIVNSGKGSDKVTSMFKKAVYFSEDPKRLPKKVQNKLSKGPRIASQGYGHI